MRGYDLETAMTIEEFISTKPVTLIMPGGDLTEALKTTLSFHIDPNTQSIANVDLTAWFDRAEVLRLIKAGVVALTPLELLRFDPNTPIVLVLSASADLLELVGRWDEDEEWDLERLASLPSPEPHGFPACFNLALYQHIELRTR